MSCTLSEIKLAAYNWKEPQGATERDLRLWKELGYCYEWYRMHPEDKADCDALAKDYIEMWEEDTKSELYRGQR